MKTIKVSILICLFGLLFVGYSFSGNIVTENPVNFAQWTAYYDYRETNPPYWYPDYMSGNTMFFGPEGTSGGYFRLLVTINPGFGSCLTDHSQITEVKAKWLGEPNYEFSLLPGTCFNEMPYFPGYPECQEWSIMLRTAPWQFKRPWEFNLTYYCPNDHKDHIQTMQVQPNRPDRIPPKPTGILIQRPPAGDYFYVSWTGMGDPSDHPFLEYRIIVYDDEDNCPVAFLGTRFRWPVSTLDWWSYDAFLNRIKINVPTTYAGKTIRIENRNGSGMPSYPPNIPGGKPSSAVVRTRLPEYY